MQTLTTTHYLTKLFWGTAMAGVLLSANAFAQEKIDRVLDTEAENCVQEADLAGIACPVLVVVGEDDPIYSSAQIRGVADRIAAARGPGAAGDVETVVLPCGHSTYYEMPAVFSAMVARLAASA